MSEENKAIKLLEEIGQKVDDNTKEGKEIKALAAEAKKESGELTAKIVTMQADIEAKGATIGQILEEQKEMKAKAGRPKAGDAVRQYVGDVIAEALYENKGVLESLGLKDKPARLGPKREAETKGVENKAVGPILSANLSGTGNNYISYLDWRPGMEPTGQFRFRNIFRTINSETDFVRFPRANTPIGEGSFAKVTEGATKPQVDRDYTMIDLTLNPIAGFAIVSRQSLRNIVFLQSWLPTSMMEQLMDQEDLEFANALVAAATGSTSTTGFTVTDSYGKLLAYITRLTQAKYKTNFIAGDPLVWANLLTLQSTGATGFYQQPGFVSITPDGQVRLLGIPFYPVNWLGGGRILTGDSTKAAIVQSEGLVLRQSDSHASIFTSNEIAFLLERTEGLAIFRPDAFQTAVF